MSQPLTPDEIVRAFRKWHVRYEQHKGWRTHRRDPSHGDWGPVNGLVLHHTGDDAPDDADENVLWFGRSGLPGPLCTWAMRDDGVAVLIGGGRANHAGLGAQNVLDAVIREDYTYYPPKPGAETVDGNTRFYAQETMYSGGHPMSLAAYRNTVLAFAAICDAHNWSAKSCIGHKEWTKRKWDPGHLSMRKFRNDVQACLDAGPGNWPKREPVLRPEVTKLRTHIKGFLKTPRRPAVKRALVNADRVLARIEYR